MSEVMAAGRKVAIPFRDTADCILSGGDAAFSDVLWLPKKMVDGLETRMYCGSLFMLNSSGTIWESGG
jgi:hypothetical protein